MSREDIVTTVDGVRTRQRGGDTIMTCVESCERPLRYKVNRWFHYNVYIPYRLMVIARRLREIDKKADWLDKRLYAVRDAYIECLKANSKLAKYWRAHCEECNDALAAYEQASVASGEHLVETLDESESLDREARDLKGMLEVYRTGSVIAYQQGVSADVGIDARP